MLFNFYRLADAIIVFAEEILETREFRKRRAILRRDRRRLEKKREKRTRSRVDRDR